MKLPPKWKVKRELTRIKQQIRSFPIDKFTFPLRFLPFFFYRRIFLREMHGSVSLTGRVAVFVLFQPKGVARSSFLTLDYLAKNNWSVVVISNAKLTDTDRHNLAKKSSYVIERPNIGYDFGAYRDGWNWLHKKKQDLDRLILMNDSTWFPLRADDTSLARMEAHGSDLTGHIFKNESAEQGGQDHVEAHLLMFSKRLIAHPKMHEFWQNYQMSNSRVTTIHRGEKGITGSVLDAAMNANGLLNREIMVDLISRRSMAELKDIVEEFVVFEDSGFEIKQRFSENYQPSEIWKNEVIGWVGQQLQTSRFNFISAAFVYPAIKIGGMGFLKKSNEIRFHLARAAALRNIEEGRIPAFAPEVMAEMRALVDNYDNGPDWRA